MTTRTCTICGYAHKPGANPIAGVSFNDPSTWPEGTPSFETIRDWTLGLSMENPEAVDGCTNVEPDGQCPHGCPAFPRALGLI